MIEKESEISDANMNYEVLAKIYTIINDKITKKSIAMEKVLQKNFDINYRVPSSKCSLPHIAGHNALDFALDKRELEVFKMLIKRGADFTNTASNGNTILHDIIQKSCVKNNQCYTLRGKLEYPFVELVLSAHIEYNKTANPQDPNGVSHFHIACMFNHVRAVEFFLAEEVSIDQAISQTSQYLPGCTPLHLVARYSALESAKVLLEHNADVNIKNTEGIQPLHLLIQRNIEILNWVNVQKQQLCEKLEKEFSANEGIIKLLLEKTVSFEEGLSRCHIACTLQDTKILEKILVEGVNLNDSVDKNSSLWPGYTALHFAAIGNIDALKLLLANGSNILAKDANGVTPWDLCLERYSSEVLHSIIINVPELNQIDFLNTNKKLSDLIFAMMEEETLRIFLHETAGSINMCLPSDSLIWPGYTVLHIAIALSKRYYENRDLYTDTDYENERDTRNNYDEEEYLYESGYSDYAGGRDILNNYNGLKYFNIIKLCLTMGADINITDCQNSTPLHLAFRLQNWCIVTLLLMKHKKLVNAVDDANLSHLHIACTVKMRNFAEKLLDSQPEIDSNQPVMLTFDYRFSNPDMYTLRMLHVNPGWTCLHFAVASSTVQLVKKLIDYKADLYAKDSYGMTPVHYVFCSDFRFSDSYFSSPLDDRVTNFGLTHLHAACFSGALETVKKLIKVGADIEAKINYKMISHVPGLSFLAEFDGYTPLCVALKKLHIDVLKLLVQHGANLFAESDDGLIYFYKNLKSSIRIGDRYFSNYESDDEADYQDEFSDNEVYNYYLSRDYANSFALEVLSNERIERLVKENSGITKLHIACLEIKPFLVKHLLKNKVEPNAQVQEKSPIWSGFTPLHMLMIPRYSNDNHEYEPRVYEGIKKIGKLLLENGASVMLKNTQGNTPIHMTQELLWCDSKIREEGFRIVDWILEGIKDFKENPVDTNGISHFHIACMSAQDEIVHQFLEKCVDLDVNSHFGHFTDRYGGFTALHLACFYKTHEVLITLLEYGASASAHARDFLGNTPFHSSGVYCQLGNNFYRTYNAHIDEILVDYVGIDIEAKNLWNETPLALIVRMDLLISNTLYTLLNKDITCRLNVFSLENEEGLLGIALQNNHLKIEHLNFYRAVVSSPDTNDVDEMGRTVIHNVVSVKKPLNDHWKPGSIDSYVNMIHEFIKLDFDIDYQDKTGQTALHKAVRFHNYNGIVGLLANGADINIVDSTKRSAFSYIFACENNNDNIRCNIIKAYLLHVYKLQLAKLEISKANKELVEQFRKESISQLKETKFYSTELEILKKDTITNSYSKITMYNILCETMSYYRVMLLIRDIIDKIFITNVATLREKHPQFTGLLQMQYRNVFVRSQLIEPAKLALSNLVEFPMPELCSDNILKYLNNKDLKQLIAATENGTI